MGIDRLLGLANAALNAKQSSQASGLSKEVEKLQASQSEMAQLQKQLLALQEENRDLQERQALEQQARELQAKRQKEIKDIAFRARTAVDESLTETDQVIKAVSLRFSHSLLTTNGISPDELDSLEDKQFCRDVLKDLTTQIDAVGSELAPEQQSEVDNVVDTFGRADCITHSMNELAERAEPVMARVCEGAEELRQKWEKKLRRRRRWLVFALLISAVGLISAGDVDVSDPIVNYVFWGGVLLVSLVGAKRYWTLRSVLKASNGDYEMAKQFSEALRPEIQALESEMTQIEAQSSELAVELEAIMARHPGLKGQWGQA